MSVLTIIFTIRDGSVTHRNGIFFFNYVYICDHSTGTLNQCLIFNPGTVTIIIIKNNILISVKYIHGTVSWKICQITTH